MRNMMEKFQLTVLAAALMTVFGPARAEEGDELRQLTKPDSAVSFGAGYWDRDRPQQGIYDGMRDKGSYGLLDAEIVRRDEATGTWLNFRGRNLGLDTREIRGEVLRQGDIGAFVESDRIVRRHPLQINTGLQGIGGTNMTVSGALAGSSDFRLLSNPVVLGTERDLLHLGFYKNVVEGIDLNVSFKNEEKTGTRHWGLGSAPAFLAEPIDTTTRQLKMSVDYTAERLQLTGGYYGSWFENDNSLVLARVNNGVNAATTPGDARSPTITPLTLPLDNQAHQLFLNGGYNFTPTTRGMAKLSYTRATQDQRLPTFDLAFPNDRFVGAPSSLDGEVNTTVAQVGLSSQPLPKLSLVANLRYQDVDDKTPLRGFVGSNTTGAITVHNTPHSFATTSGKLEATYQLPERFNLIGGVDLSRQDRSYPLFEAERFVPFRSKLDENTYRLQLRRSLSETVNGSIAYLRSERDGSEFLATEEFPSDLINPIHIADRDRNKWRATVDWAPTESFSLQGNVEDSRDEYGNSASRPYGLRDGAAQLYSLDATYSLSENWSMTGWYSHDKTKANQFGARWTRPDSTVTPPVLETYELDKAYHLKDVGDSVGFGVRGSFASKVKIGADLQWTRNRSEYRDEISTTGPGLALTPDGAATAARTARGTTPLPDIENKLTKLALFAQYALDKRSELRADFIHERWETNDWTWMVNNAAFTYTASGSGSAASPFTDGTTVSVNPKQISNFVGVRYIYRYQ